MGLNSADKQWTQPAFEMLPEDIKPWVKEGYSPQTRFWIDDMFMITMLQTQAYRATSVRNYLDRTAREMVLYLDQLQQPNGLFFHAPDVPIFWARGNGWFAAGTRELLQFLPEGHSDRPRIMDGYRKMMASLLKHQDESGLWRQIIDDPESWLETSGTAMFAYGFVAGVRNGWLDPEAYGPAARKAWIALVGYLEPSGNLREVCVGTGKRNDRQHDSRARGHGARAR